MLNEAHLRALRKKLARINTAVQQELQAPKHRHLPSQHELACEVLRTIKPSPITQWVTNSGRLNTEALQTASDDQQRQADLVISIGRDAPEPETSLGGYAFIENGSRKGQAVARQLASLDIQGEPKQLFSHITPSRPLSQFGGLDPATILLLHHFVIREASRIVLLVDGSLETGTVRITPLPLALMFYRHPVLQKYLRGFARKSNPKTWPRTRKLIPHMMQCAYDLMRIFPKAPVISVFDFHDALLLATQWCIADAYGFTPDQNLLFFGPQLWSEAQDWDIQDGTRQVTVSSDGKREAADLSGDDQLSESQENIDISFNAGPSDELRQILQSFSNAILNLQGTEIVTQTYADYTPPAQGGNKFHLAAQLGTVVCLAQEFEKRSRPVADVAIRIESSHAARRGGELHKYGYQLPVAMHDVNALDVEGLRPLAYAARNNDLEVAHALCRIGAFKLYEGDITTTDPLNLARPGSATHDFLDIFHRTEKLGLEIEKIDNLDPRRHKAAATNEQKPFERFRTELFAWANGLEATRKTALNCYSGHFLGRRAIMAEGQTQLQACTLLCTPATLLAHLLRCLHLVVSAATHDARRAHLEQAPNILLAPLQISEQTAAEYRPTPNQAYAFINVLNLLYRTLWTNDATLLGVVRRHPVADLFRRRNLDGTRCHTETSASLFSGMQTRAVQIILQYLPHISDAKTQTSFLRDVLALPLLNARMNSAGKAQPDPVQRLRDALKQDQTTPLKPRDSREERAGTETEWINDL